MTEPWGKAGGETKDVDDNWRLSGECSIAAVVVLTGGRGLNRESLIVLCLSPLLVASVASVTMLSFERGWDPLEQARWRCRASPGFRLLGSNRVEDAAMS